MAELSAPPAGAASDAGVVYVRQGKEGRPVRGAQGQVGMGGGGGGRLHVRDSTAESSVTAGKRVLWCYTDKMA